MSETQSIDVFVSYSSFDREQVRPLVEALEKANLHVWWDTRIAPGAGFDAAIQTSLDEARCVVVVWSENSIGSEWVITEASEGLERGILVPVSIDGSRPPLAFRRRQTLSAPDSKSAKQDLVAAVRAVLEGGTVEVPSQRHTPSPRRRSPIAFGQIALALAVGALAAYWLSNLLQDPAAAGSPTRVALELPGWIGQRSYHAVPSMVISPDGEKIVFVAEGASGEHILKLRRLDRLDTVELDGTEGAEKPFFSADGQWVGYYDSGIMKRAPVNGGDPSVVTRLDSEPWGTSWGTDDRIVYAGTSSGLSTVSISGGEVETLTEVDVSRSEHSHRLPHHIAGAEALLFSVIAGRSNHEIWVLDLTTGERRYLLDGLSPHYVQSGHIVFARMEGTARARGSLWAVSFDKDSLAITGPEQSVQGPVGGREGSAFSVGHTGPLIYLPSQGEQAGEIVLFDADGSRRKVAEGPVFWFPRFSHDGRRIAVTAQEQGRYQSVWIYDIASGAARQISQQGIAPLWSYDDQRVLFSTQRGLVEQPVDGFGSEHTVVPGWSGAPNTWLASGRTLVLHGFERPGIYSLDPGAEPQLRVDHPKAAFATFTEDERWVAFCTWQRGIVIGRFPEYQFATKVTESGCVPKWGPRDEHLYFQDGSTLWSVKVELGENVLLGEPRPVADLGYRGAPILYDVDRRGRVVIARISDSDPKPLVLYSNWSSQLD